MKASILKLAAVSILTLSTGAFASEYTTTVRLTSGEWPPYTSRELPGNGIFSNIVCEAFALEGIKVSYIFMPWKRAYNMARDGEYDGSVTWARTSDREKDFYFSDTVTLNKKAFFHLTDRSFDWNELLDLRKYRLGITRQYTYGEDFDQYVKDGMIRAEVVGHDRQNVLKLVGGRIDAFPMEINVGYSLIKKVLSPEQAARVKHHEKTIHIIPISVVISKNISEERSQFLLEKLNSGLKRLRDSGRYDELLQGAHSIVQE